MVLASVADLDSVLVVDDVRVLYETRIDLWAHKELLNTPHGKLELVQLRDEQGGHPHGLSNVVKDELDGVSGGQV